MHELIKCIIQNVPLKVRGQYIKSNTFIQEGCIELNKSDSFNVTKQYKKKNNVLK